MSAGNPTQLRGNGVDVELVVDVELTVLVVDDVVVAKDAPHVGPAYSGAHVQLNALGRP